MNLDLNSLLTSLTQTANQRASGIANEVNRMNQETAAMQSVMQDNVAATAKVADEAANIARQEAAVIYQQDQVKQQAQVVLGMDPENMENELIKSMGEYDFAEAERKRTRQQFEQLSSIQFLDNPIAYVMAQLQMPAVAARNNELVALRDSATENIQTRQQLLAAQKSTVTANTADQVKQINLAKAANNRKLADIQLKEAELENASKLAGRRLQAFQLSDKIYDVQSDLINKQLQIGQYMMSLEERREARAERAAAAAERAANKQKEADEIMALDVQFQRVSQWLGMTTPMTFEIWKKMPDKKKQQAWLEAATTGAVGNDIISTVQFISQQGNPAVLKQNNPGVAKSVEGFSAALDSYAGTVQREAASKGEKPKTTEIVQRAQDMYVNEVISSASRPGSGNSLTSKRWDSVFNPYKAQHKVLLDEVAANPKHPLQNNEFVNALVTAENVKGGKGADLTSEDEQRALGVMVEAVKARQLSPDEAAAQISQYYRYSMNKNSDLFQYELFNLPPQTRYMGQIGTKGLFGKVTDADLSDPVQVKKALVEQVRVSTPTLTVPGFGVPSMRANEVLIRGTGAVVDVLMGRQPADK